VVGATASTDTRCPVPEPRIAAEPIWRIGADSEIGARQGREAASDDSGCKVRLPWRGTELAVRRQPGAEIHAHRSPGRVSRKLLGITGAHACHDEGVNMFPSRRRKRLGGVAAIAAAALLAAGCGGSSGGGSSSSSPSSGAAVTGGTARIALPAGVTYSWIFPFYAITNASVYNSEQFQWLMYRPLYMFGNNTNNNVAINYPLSPANPPVYSNGGKTVKVPMKGWKWSNGETVDANSLIFYMNMVEAETANWYAT